MVGVNRPTPARAVAGEALVTSRAGGESFSTDIRVKTYIDVRADRQESRPLMVMARESSSSTLYAFDLDDANDIFSLILNILESVVLIVLRGAPGLGNL